MSKHRTIWLSPKVNIEVMIDVHAPILRINIQLQQIRPLFGHIWVELLVPIREQAVADIQPLAISTAQMQAKTCEIG